MEKKSKKGLKIALVIIGVVVLLAAVLLIFGSSDDEYDHAQTEDEYYSDDNLKEDDAEEYEDDEAYAEDAGDGEKKTARNPDQTWTIMVHMCGTDLESEYECGSANLEEMYSADLGSNREKVNVLVQTGGTKEWGLNEYVAAF